VSDPIVDNCEVKGKQKYRDDDHGGRCLNFLPAGKGDLAHFIANVRKKTFGARRKLLQPSAEALFVPRNYCCFCHPIPTFLKDQLAGAEGFEPQSSVLETDSLTVELTPLHELGNCQNRLPNLLHFFVRRVLAAPLTKLAEFQSTSCGLLVFGGGIIALFAISTL
jgi:hypothetical protein